MKTNSVELGRRKNNTRIHAPEKKQPTKPTHHTRWNRILRNRSFSPEHDNQRERRFKMCIRSQKMRLVKKTLIKVSPFTPQVSDPNTFKLAAASLSSYTPKL